MSVSEFEVAVGMRRELEQTNLSQREGSDQDGKEDRDDDSSIGSTLGDENSTCEEGRKEEMEREATRRG